MQSTDRQAHAKDVLFRVRIRVLVAPSARFHGTQRAELAEPSRPATWSSSAENPRRAGGSTRTSPRSGGHSSSQLSRPQEQPSSMQTQPKARRRSSWPSRLASSPRPGSTSCAPRTPSGGQRHRQSPRSPRPRPRSRPASPTSSRTLTLTLTLTLTRILTLTLTLPLTLTPTPAPTRTVLCPTSSCASPPQRPSRGRARSVEP